MTSLLNSLGGAGTAVLDSFLRIADSLYVSTLETLYMVLTATACSLFFGFFLAVIMIITGPHGLSPAPLVYRCIDFITNMLRSLPFIILLIAIMPLTRLVTGTVIGTNATILPLTIAAAPFAARLIEGSFLEVDAGVIEASRSFGASLWQTIFKVMLPEALPSIILNISVLAIALLGYSAMAGVVGGGGLGDLAYQYGYNRFEEDVIVWCVLLLVIMVQLIQGAGNYLYKRLR